MTATRELLQLGSIILLRLLTPLKNGHTCTNLSKELKPILAKHLSGSEQLLAIDEEIAALVDAGQVKRVKRSQLVLTDEGRRAALATRGMTALPGKATWRTVKKYVIASELSIPTGKGLTKPNLDAEHEVAAILKYRYQLRISDNPTLTEAMDALVWQHLKVANTGPLTLEAIRALVLGLLLGTQTQQKDPKKIATQLAATAVGSTRVKIEDIELAILHRWLSGEPVMPQVTDAGHGADTTAKPSEPVVKPTAAVEREPISDDKSFAARVLEAARASKTGRFGEDKVFISHVFRNLVDEGAIADDAKAFKDRLISAHRDDHLTLSRADLVGAMKPEDVDSSEAKYLGATFHFIHV